MHLSHTVVEREAQAFKVDAVVTCGHWRKGRNVHTIEQLKKREADLSGKAVWQLHRSRYQCDSRAQRQTSKFQDSRSASGGGSGVGRLW